MRDLESLGVQVWTGAAVTNVSAEGVSIGSEKLAAATVLWAAGVRAADIGRTLGIEVDRAGRVPVGADLTIANHPEVFVAGDMAQSIGENGKPLPGVALVAMQQGIYFADVVRREVKAAAASTHRHPDGSRDPSRDSDVRRNDGRKPFRYVDLGSMATIGRSRAIAEFGRLRLSGWFAWWFWLVVHIYRLSGFRNRLSVLIQWAWSYLTFSRGARLIVGKEWRAYGETEN
jgi:NADH dehydrogenase